MKVKLKINNNKSDCKSLKVLDLESLILFRPGCLNVNFRMPIPPKITFLKMLLSKVKMLKITLSKADSKTEILNFLNTSWVF